MTDQLYTRLADFSGDGVMRYTFTEGRILFANQGLVDILELGCAPDKVVGRLMRDLLIYTEKEGLVRATLAREGEIHGFEYHFKTLNGKDKWVLHNSFIIEDPVTKEKVVEAVVRDITHRKRAEEALRESRQHLAEMYHSRTGELQETEARYRALIEQIPAITYVAAMDEKSTTLFISPQISMLGLSPEECRNRPDFWREQLHPDDRARVLRELFAHRTAGGPFALEYRMIAGDGSVMWIRDQAMLIRDKTGAPLCLQGVMFDITDQKRMEDELRKHQRQLAQLIEERTAALREANEKLVAQIAEHRKGEEALRNSEARYRSLFDDSPIPLWEEDFSEVKSHIDNLRRRGVTDLRAYFAAHPESIFESLGKVKVLRVNHATRKIYNFPDNSTPPRDLAAVLGPESKGALAGALLAVASGEKHYECVCCNRKLSGEMMDVYVSWSVLPGFEETFSRVIVSVQDISARTRAEDALRESEEKYRAIFEQAPDGVVLFDALTGEFLDFNESAHRNLGYTRAEFKKLTISDFEAVESAEDTVRHFRKIIKRGADAFETKQRRKDGEIRSVLVNARSLSLGGRKLIMGVWTDITDLRKAEQSFRESERRFSAFMDHSPAIAWAKDEEGRHVYLNHTYEKRFGVRLADWRGRTDAELWPPAIAAEFRKNDLIVLRSGKPLETVEHTLNPDGSRCYWLNYKFPFRDAEGRRYVGGIGIDVSDRQRMQDILRESEEKYRSLLERSSEAILHSDTEGKLLDANKKALDLLGYSKKALLKLRYLDLHPSSEKERVSAAFIVMREKGMGGIHDTVVVRKDGVQLPVDITGGAIEFGGKKLMQGIFRDVSERKRIEKMKDNLIRDVSHELKAPIAMMEMANAMCTEAIAAGDLAAVGNARDILARNLAILSKDVNNIVGLFALSGRTVTPARSRLSLRAVADEIAEDLRDRIREHALSLRIHIASEADEITSDKRMIRTLLYNIMENAVKFTQRGVISVKARLGARWLSLQVTDTGCGIAPSERELVFTRFYKKDPSIQGTGLGLPICKEIVELYGGTIRLTPGRTGKGTSVIVRLPREAVGR